MENFGERFIHQKDSKLHTSKPVEHELDRRKKLKEKNLDEAQNLNISQKPAEKISNWLEVIERTHTNHNDDPRVLERIKKYYHKEHVIKPEDIPEAVFELEQTIARNQGHGNIEITDQFREEKTKEIISNQERSLDKWVDYLSSTDATYPMWAKYWAFNSMLKMGKLEKKEDEETGEETMRFRKRDKHTAAPFPVINPRALAMTISAISDKAEQNSKNKDERITPDNLSTKLSEEEFKQLVSTENFSKIYSQFLIEMPEYSTEGLKETRGEWRTYKKGSEPDELVESLDGHPLEWCTANIDTARSQLQGGDFHVYYSMNEKDEPVIPRVAIRMQDNNIAEVRGIAANQNLDPYIGDVVQEKMTEFPDGEKYQKKTEDMKRLTEIEEKYKKQEELSNEDLRFLYEIDNKIEGFGYRKDPRIEEIINNRDAKKDISKVIGCKEDEVSLTQGEALSGNIKYHYGSLVGDSAFAEGLRLPDEIGGHLHLGDLTSAEGMKLPHTIGGILDLGDLTSAEGLKLPHTIGGNLDLRSLTSAEGLKLPGSIGGRVNLRSLTSAEGLKLPHTIGGSLYLDSLTSTKGLKLPDKVGENLKLCCLTSVEGLELPDEVGGYIYLDRLTSIEKKALKDRYSQFADKIK